MHGRTELTNVAKLGDDLWLGVICQTNSEIACSPRNSFRASVARCLTEVEHWMVLGAFKVIQPNQTPNADGRSPAVGPREMSFAVERERTQTDG